MTTFNRIDLDRLVQMCQDDRKIYLDLIQCDEPGLVPEYSTQQTAHTCLRYLAKCIQDVSNQRYELLKLVEQAKPVTHGDQLALEVIAGELEQLASTHELYRQLSTDLVAEYGHYQRVQPYRMSKSEARRLLEQCRSTSEAE